MLLCLSRNCGMADDLVHFCTNVWSEPLGLTSTTYRGPFEDRIPSSEPPRHRPFLPLHSGLDLDCGMLWRYIHLNSASST